MLFSMSQPPLEQFLSNGHEAMDEFRRRWQRCGQVQERCGYPPAPTQRTRQPAARTQELMNGLQRALQSATEWENARLQILTLAAYANDHELFHAVEVLRQAEASIRDQFRRALG